MNNYLPKLKALQTITLLISALVAAPQIGNASIANSLSPEQLDLINRGQEVLVTRDLNKTWPEIIIYRRINAPANKVSELFLDYEGAHTYVPNLKSAIIESTPSKNTKDVRYTIRIPFINTISYLVRNKYEQTPEGHKISWSLLESPIVEAAAGSLTIEPLNETSSIIRYSNHIEPATSLLAGLKGHAIREASTTVKAIARKSESLAKK
jgi:hypothetical protein